MVLLGLFLAWRINHKNPDAIWLWGMSLVCELCFAFSWLLDQLPKLCPVNHTTNLSALKDKFELPTPSNPTGKPDLPRIDIFVSTADPDKEPLLVTANTILSILAAEYPVEKLACYVSDDGGSLLTFEAISKAASFASIWVPFCRKHCIEPRNLESYFALNPYKNKVCQEFVGDHNCIKHEYKKFKDHINNLPDSIRRRCDSFQNREELNAARLHRKTTYEPMVKIPKATWMANRTHWHGTWTQPTTDHFQADHASIILVILKRPEEDLVFDTPWSY